MRITIIGGSGFVGTRLIEVFGNGSSNHQITNVDKQQSPFYKDLTVIANVLDKESLKNLLKGTDLVILLAAEHRDDVSPKSLYYDVNVQGMKNVLEAMRFNQVKRLIFTSSVAVYGLNKKNPDENHPIDPFNDYGKSKWQAEQVLQEWYKEDSSLNFNIIRPTVIFGERNRGNVYNLLRQISSGKFLMIGSGNNKKSMAYVGNIVAFLRYLAEDKLEGYNVFNYVDKPDFTMNELAKQVGEVLQKQIPTVHIPYWAGLMGGYGFDVLAKIKRKKLNISSVRVRKFCATTMFDAAKVGSSTFKAPYTLQQGLSNTLMYEFVKGNKKDDITFITE